MNNPVRCLLLTVLVVSTGCAVRAPPESVTASDTVTDGGAESPVEQTVPDRAYRRHDDPATTPTPPPASPRSDVNVTVVQRQVVTELDDLRRGLAPAVFEDPRLSAFARKKSYHMAANDYVGHQPPDGDRTLKWLKDAGYECGAFGETLLQTAWKAPIEELDGQTITTESGLAQEVVAGLADSPPHKQLLLSARYHTTGVGIYVTEDGTVYATILLCS